jgi:hypothetical protein
MAEEQVMEAAQNAETMPGGGESVAPAGGGDWRAALAGEDRSALKTLSRFSDGNAFWKSYQSMRQRLSSGDRSALSPDATAEQVAEWRLANGIPETAQAYEIALEDGLQIGESDRALVDQYLDVAHKLNHTPDQVNANLNWYFALARQHEEGIADANLAARNDCEAELREDWGAEYRATLNGIASMLDGTNLLNQPGVMRWLAELSRELNPVATVVGAGGASLTGIEDEIAQIEGVMREDRSKYNRDERMQERLRKLYGARERLRRG